ncbi:unnamed protein product [Caenorhabditis nigoni]
MKRIRAYLYEPTQENALQKKRLASEKQKVELTTKKSALLSNTHETEASDAGSRMLMLADEPIYRCHTPSATSSTSQGWFTPLLRSMDTLSLVIVSAQTPIIQKLQGS